MSERPVECGQCKRPVKILYKEVVDNTVTCTEMCADCPILQDRLHGEIHKTDKSESQLCCSNCGTSIESARIGQPLGCAECYAVFADFIIGELIAADGIPSSLQKKLGVQRTQPIHIGKTPDKPLDIVLSSRMASLNEALNDALKRENYEQAAWLRDQIKSLKENEK